MQSFLSLLTASRKWIVFLVVLLPGTGELALAQLAVVGPVSPSNGFPLFYRDTNGLALELCLDQSSRNPANTELKNRLCALEEPNPLMPISFPNNFGEEAFWWLAESVMDLPGGGRAKLVLSLEASFSADLPVDGDQITFGRVRIRIDVPENVPVAGLTYTVTYPFGTKTFLVHQGGRRAINYTQDVGIAPGDFSMALKSKIGPFLTWSPVGEAPAGFIGDPAVPHVVTGGTHGNVFKIEAPNIGGPGVNSKVQNLFTLMGKRATVFGVSVDRASYTRNELGLGTVEVFASTAPGQTLEVSGVGVTPVMMTEDVGKGRYSAHIPFNFPLPSEITATNRDDEPDTVIRQPLRDVITITEASYDLVTQLLHVAANSADTGFGGFGLTPGLEVFANGLSLGNLTDGVLSVFQSAPPARIRVQSSVGGFDTKIVTVTDEGAPPRIVSPVPGSTLGDNRVLFSWEVGSSSWDEYAIWIGSALGPTDFFTSLAGANLSITAFNLPVDGQPVFVRLWYRNAGEDWRRFKQFQYQAATAPTMVFPGRPGSTLAGASTTFAWSSGSGWQQYWLQVGSTAGVADIFSLGTGFNVSQLVTAIPTDGRPLFVRLWYTSGATRRGGGLFGRNVLIWHFKDFQYTASSLP